MSRFQIPTLNERVHMMQLDEVRMLTVLVAESSSPEDLADFVDQAALEADTPDGQARHDEVIRTIGSLSRLGIVSQALANNIINS